MKIFIGLLILIFLAFSGYHLTFRRFRMPLFARRFYLTGTEYLFLGLLLGPQFLNLLDAQTLSGLEPLTALVLGWAGLLFGFQFEISKLRRFPLEFFAGAIMEGIITFTWVFVGIFTVLYLLGDMTASAKPILAIALASASACTAQTALALLPSDTAARHRLTVKLLSYLSGIDGLVTLICFGTVFLIRPRSVMFPSWVGQAGWGLFVWLGASLGLSLLYLMFFTRHRKENELILIVIGVAVFTSGTASALHFSPLLTNFFVGFCLVNLSRERERIFNILIRVEKPVYLLILVFLGVNWQFDSVLVLGLAAVYCLWRGLGKFLGGFVVTRLSPALEQYPSRLGFGLLEMGGLSLAMLLDFLQQFPGDIMVSGVSVVLVAVIYNGFLSSGFLEQLLKKNQ
jgi:hypothetical protein